MTHDGLVRLEAMLKAGVEDDAIFSGAQLGLYTPDLGPVVLTAGHTCWAGFGPDNTGPKPVTPHVLFDLASLTKMVVTAPLCWRAIGEGFCDPDEPVARWLPDWASGRKAGVTVRHLLTHTSGLPAWEAFYRSAILPGASAQEQAEAIRARVLQAKLDVKPATRSCYSDLGYILLGIFLERCLGDRLDNLAAQHIFEPLGMNRCRFVDVHQTAPKSHEIFAATEATEVARCGASLAGQVHDENTWMLGGIAGHAGLFGTAGDLVRFGRAILESDGGPRVPWSISSAVVRWALSSGAGCHNAQGEWLGPYLAGVDTPSGAVSTAGSVLARSPIGASVGHLGFTGTSLWIDRTRGLVMALLTNRVHPTRDKEGIRAFRTALHTTAAQILAPETRTTLWPTTPSLSDQRGLGRCVLPGRGQRALDVAIAAARTAGAHAAAAYARNDNLETEHKSASFDLVTKVGLACEAMIVKMLREAFPEWGCLREESGKSDKESPYVWVVDPIDGTTNFSHRLGHFCVSIALMFADEVQVGVIFDPVRDELFWAVRGRGSYLNGRPIAVSSCRELGRALTATGFPYDRHTAQNNNSALTSHMLRHVQGLRRLGSAALDLAYVACGRLDLYWEQRIKPLDCAAGLLLVDEAGGRITGLHGEPFSIDAGNIVASCGGLLHQSTIAQLQKAHAARPQESV